jgi:hypothetical protein
VRLLRNGPVVRKRTTKARVDHGPTPPLKLLASARHSGVAHEPEGRPPAPPNDSTSLRLDGHLPLILRTVLLQELGGILRIVNNTIYSLVPGLGEVFTRELARAIRRFSFERARERWVEFSVSSSRLEELLRSASGEGRGVVLCLRCAALGAASSEAGEHPKGRCLTLTLGANLLTAAVDSVAHIKALIHHGLYDLIDAFRNSRAAENLAHFDLDYYIRNGSVIFTWRPLPPEANDL